MTRGETFEDSFWDPEITSTAGWDRLLKRMKDGRKVCHDVAQYFKERGKIENDYSKALFSLAKKFEGNEEIGVLGKGWGQMQTATEDLYKVHDETSKEFSLFAEELSRFNEDQKKGVKTYEDSVKKAHKHKMDCYNRTIGMKKTYEGKCRDYEVAKENIKTLMNTVSRKEKDIEKSEKQLEKCKDAMWKEDFVYKSSVDALEKARLVWEKSMEEACQIYQKLEEERIEYMRNKLWEATNADSLACLKHDETCETVRLALEPCDITEDIRNFIKNNKSGNRRPGRVDYENYYQKSPSTSATSPIVKTPGARAVLPTRPPAPMPPTLASTRTFDFEETGYASVDDLKAETLSRPDPLQTDDGHYASVDVSNVRPPPTTPKPKVPLSPPQGNAMTSSSGPAQTHL